MSDDQHDQNLWQRVEHYREMLKDCDDYPTAAGLRDAWELLQTEQPDSIKELHASRLARNPIDAIMFCIDMGEYPAPELLLTMLECYGRYRNFEGTLEEQFFGKPKQRAGNHAKRSQGKIAELRIRFMFSSLLRKGKTRMQAAEQIVSELGLNVDPESLLRQLVGFNGFVPSEN